MTIKVHTGPLLSPYTNNQRTVEVNGDTVNKCLKHLTEQFPKLNLFDKDDKLLDYLCIYVNGEITDLEKVDKPVKDGDELSIILMFSGG